MFPFRRQSPTPEPEALTPTERVWRVVQIYVERLPYVPQIRIFVQDLRAEQEWWPILLPILVFVGWNSYRKERRRLRRRR